MKNSQALSIDIMLGIIVFIGAIFFFYSVFSQNKESDITALEADASKIMKAVSSGDEISVLTGTEIDIDKIQALLGEEYTDIKNKLRVGSDFCIFIEDESDNIIYLSASSQSGVGSNKIKVSDIPCS